MPEAGDARRVREALDEVEGLERRRLREALGVGRDRADERAEGLLDEAAVVVDVGRRRRTERLYHKKYVRSLLPRPDPGSFADTSVPRVPVSFAAAALVANTT